MLQKMLRNGYSNKAIMDVMEHYCLPPPINKLCIFIINVQQSRLERVYIISALNIIKFVLNIEKNNL